LKTLGLALLEVMVGSVPLESNLIIGFIFGFLMKENSLKNIHKL
jgi:hypothetical protein